MQWKIPRQKDLVRLARHDVNYDIPVILQVACALAMFVHPSHIVIYAPGDSLTCRLHATRIILGIDKSRRSKI
ncbi:hypothetical protein CO701_01435 [Citrobacter werkmanii]|nr:hypothetical protein CO701_01435 [Citrobacter werkmanii]